MTIAVAIVNWNSGGRLRQCIESLLATTAIAEILVVDNASTDTSMESVAMFRERVDFILNSVNRGFAAAVNQAFQSTSTSYVLVLNPDIRATPGAVSTLQKFLDAHPRAGAVGGYVNEKSLPRDFPTVGTLVRENLGVPRQRRTIAKESDAVSVEQPAAAALMIRRDAYESAGGFDEQFFPAWYEDVDFCRRLKVAGWDIYYAPRAEFLHEGGYSVSGLGPESFAQAYYSNQVRYARKYFGAMGSAVVRGSVALGMIGRMIGRPKRAAAYGKVLIGALKGW